MKIDLPDTIERIKFKQGIKNNSRFKD